MKCKVIDDILVDFNVEDICNELKIRDGSGMRKRVEELVEQAYKVAKPKGIYNVCFIDEKGKDYIISNDIRFNSRILRVNIGEANKMFPYIATCGKEIQEWANGNNDILDQYILDKILEVACRCAVKELFNCIDNKYKLKNASKMNPGSLEEWPIEEQFKLFNIFNGNNEDIGVELNDSFLMNPKKSVSGIRFSSEVKFYNCQLCPNIDCPERKAPYNKELYNSRYGLK